MASLLVLFAFGAVLTGVVYLGIVQAREEAKKRRRVMEAESRAETGRPHLYIDAA